MAKAAFVSCFWRVELVIPPCLQVAVKTLKAELFHNSTDLEDFVKEGVLLRSLDHPCAFLIFSCFECGLETDARQHSVPGCCHRWITLGAASMLLCGFEASRAPCPPPVAQGHAASGIRHRRRDSAVAGPGEAISYIRLPISYIRPTLIDVLRAGPL